MYIDKKEVLRYLRCKGSASDDISQMIDECISACAEAARPLYVYDCYDISETEHGIAVEGTNIILTGRDISEHLRGCRRCIIMAATIGAGVDTAVRVAQAGDMPKAVTLDACATACIEELCDIICRDIEEEARRRGEHITQRFSPGYGDLPLNIQSSILKALGAVKRIGLTLTDADIMIPRKSVTAIIGIKKSQCKAAGSAGCDNCRLSECHFRRLP